MSDQDNKIRKSFFRSGNISAGGGSIRNINVQNTVSNGNIVNGSVGAIQRNYSSESQLLAEIASEIRRLLHQLEETNPAATAEEKVSYLNLTMPPEMKKQTISVLSDSNQSAGFSKLLFFLKKTESKVVVDFLQEWLRK